MVWFRNPENIRAKAPVDLIDCVNATDTECYLFPAYVHTFYKDIVALDFLRLILSTLLLLQVST